MGMRIEDYASVMLENIKQSAPRGALAAMRKGAEDIQELAREMAPVEKHNLEESIQIAEDREGARGRTRVFVYIDEGMAAEGRPFGVTVGDYAVYMHEGKYKLGPKSKEKQSGTSVRVGRKFLERAADELAPEIFEKVTRAIERSL